MSNVRRVKRNYNKEELLWKLKVYKLNILNTTLLIKSISLKPKLKIVWFQPSYVNN